MSDATTLSTQDVSRLLKDPSADARAALAPKLAGHLESESLSQGEFAIAHDILNMMARDTAVIVRRALADNLKHTHNLPRDVALTLARDIDDVALPILETSQVFTDEDLVELVREVPEAKQMAIARRNSLSAPVTDALIQTDNREVVRTVVRNGGADITEHSLNRVLDRFGDAEDIQDPMVRRRELPLTVAERLVSRVSDHLKTYLMTHHELSADTASELVMKARERATVNLLGPDADELDVERLAAQLHANGRLTPTLVFRALCVGDLAFFEHSMAQLAGVPVVNARTLLHDRGPLGLKSLYDKAGLPEGLFPAMRVAVGILNDTDPRAKDFDQASFGRLMLERILSNADDLHADDAAYLLRKLDDLAEEESAA
ncbi:MAG: DUF2336 domain-containing protein [Rhodospirillaceae bacterium]|nr:DUF2336 domain-containing protein [Rhodospirillaceae bacterium]